MFGRDEKVSSARLTAAQYAILGIFLVLAYGLWQSAGDARAIIYSLAAEKNRIRNVPDARAPAEEFSTAKAARLSTTIRRSRRCCCAIRPAISAGDADLIAQGLHLDPERGAGAHSALRYRCRSTSRFS